MLVLVSVCEPFLMDVGMGVQTVAVAVFMVVLDVLVLMLGMGMGMHAIPVGVLVRVGLVVGMLVVLVHLAS